MIESTGRKRMWQVGWRRPIALQIERTAQAFAAAWLHGGSQQQGMVAGNESSNHVQPKVTNVCGRQRRDQGATAELTQPLRQPGEVGGRTAAAQLRQLLELDALAGGKQE